MEAQKVKSPFITCIADNVLNVHYLPFSTNPICFVFFFFWKRDKRMQISGPAGQESKLSHRGNTAKA